jgi:D-alanine transaminase
VDPARATPHAPNLTVPSTVLVHLNGQLLPHDRAAVSPFDRGFLFGDGLYEGLRAFSTGTPHHPHRIIGLNRHIRRFQRGLDLCGIHYNAALLAPITEHLLAANHLHDAFVYWQVTRGTPDLTSGPVRSRVMTSPHPPTVFAYLSPLPPLDLTSALPAAKRAGCQRDLRWHLGHIKSISLLGNVIPAIAAHQAVAADEALLIRAMPDGRRLLGEGTYTNVAVVRGNTVRTPTLTATSILPGVTREIMLELDPAIREDEITEDELRTADEVLLIGTTTMITAVTHLDGHPVGNARPGPHAHRLMRLLCDALRENREDIPTPTPAAAPHGADA